MANVYTPCWQIPTSTKYMIKYVVNGAAYTMYYADYGNVVRTLYGGVGKRASYFAAFTPIYAYKRNGVITQMRRQIPALKKNNRGMVSAEYKDIMRYAQKPIDRYPLPD